MAKAILILDEIPKNCHECKPPRCMGYQYDIDYDAEGRPGFCPLKELPERKDTISLNNLAKEAEENHVKIESQAGFNAGWNACLDAILETED